MPDDNDTAGKRQLSDAELRQRREAGARPKALTPAALEQRREAAKHSTGPRTEEGKARSSRNAWKHGLRSRAGSLIAQNWSVGAFAKPCRTTCQYHPDNSTPPEHPCTLVLEGATRAGGDCLDKTVYVQAFDRLLDVMRTGKGEDMHEVLAAEAAGAVELLHRLREEVAEHGLVRELPALTKDGDVVQWVNPKTGERETVVGKIIGNPAVAQYTKLLEALGVDLAALLATPAALSKVGERESGEEALAELLGRAFGRVHRRPAVIDGDET